MKAIISRVNNIVNVSCFLICREDCRETYRTTEGLLVIYLIPNKSDLYISSSIGHLLHTEYKMLDRVRHGKLQTRFKALHHAILSHSKSRDKSHNSAPYKLLLIAISQCWVSYSWTVFSFSFSKQSEVNQNVASFYWVV